MPAKTEVNSVEKVSAAFLLAKRERQKIDKRKKYPPNLNVLRIKADNITSIKADTDDVLDDSPSTTVTMDTQEISVVDRPTIPLSNKFDALKELYEIEEHDQRMLEALIESNEEKKKRKVEFPELRPPQKRSHAEDLSVPGTSTGGATGPAAKMDGTRQPTERMTGEQPPRVNQGPAAPKKEKPPPISIFQQEPKHTVHLCSNILKIKDFYIKKNHEGKHSLFLNSVADYERVKGLLIKTSTSFYTYTPKSVKTQSFVLEGLNVGHVPEDIEYELKNLNIERLEFVKVSRLSTVHSRETKRILPFFLVQITANSSAGKLQEIRYVARQVVTWERLRKSEPLQCKRCQRYGHVANNCNMDYRCVKCADQHAPGECKIIKDEGTVDKQCLFCVVCKSFGHPASYRGCLKYKEFRKSIQANIMKNKEKIQKNNRPPSSLVNSKVSFAQMFKPRNSASTIPQPINGTGNTQNITIEPSLRSEIKDSANIDIQTMFSNFQKQMMSMMQQQFQCIMQVVQKNSDSITHIMETVMPVMNQLRMNP